MKVTKIVSKIPKGSIDEDLERYLRNERELERKQKIELEKDWNSSTISAHCNNYLFTTYFYYFFNTIPYISRHRINSRNTILYIIILCTSSNLF